MTVLRRLVEYAERTNLAAEMYAEVPVHWIVDLDPSGKLEGFVPLDNVRLVIPARRTETEPRPLADSAKYALGAEGADKKHAAFVELARETARETRENAVYAVVKFLEGLDPAEIPEELTGADNVAFRVGGQLVHNLESVQRFWAQASVRDDRVPGTCLVTGEDGYVERILPGKIKGVPKPAPPRGVALVSAKHKSTHHHGLESSLNFPISRRAAEKYSNALNALLRDEKSRVRIGPVVYVFWTRRAQDLGDFASFLTAPDPERVRTLLLSPHSGHEPHGLEIDDFYALALSGNPGRVVVRDYLETTVPEVEENLRRWFEAQRITDPYGQEARPLGIFALAASAYYDAKEIQPRILTALLQAALKGSPLSSELLSRAVARNRVEGDVTRARAALIKLRLRRSKGGKTMEVTVAYQCGRLLAELEAAQAAAIPNASATLVDRYYGMASTAPASAFGMLMKHSQAHLAKLRRDNPGLAHILQTRIEEITTQIGGDFPRTLALRDQGVFGLGYYNQRAATRAERRERWEAKNVREQEVG
jgi:CRISPR-associated protein Csd1